MCRNIPCPCFIDGPKETVVDGKYARRDMTIRDMTIRDITICDITIRAHSFKTLKGMQRLNTSRPDIP